MSDESAARERLLAEAERLFMAQGFAAVSTREVCAAAGVKQPSLYHHFGNKEGLYLAVVERWFAQRGERIREVTGGATPVRERLHGVALVLWTDAAGEYQAMQRDAMLHMPPEHVRRVGRLVWETFLAPVIALLREAVAQEMLPTYADTLALTQLFWAVVVGIGGSYRRGDGLPAPERNTAAIDFFLAGARGMTEEDYALWPDAGSPDIFRLE